MCFPIILRYSLPLPATLSLPSGACRYVAFVLSTIGSPMQVGLSHGCANATMGVLMRPFAGRPHQGEVTFGVGMLVCGIRTG